MSLLLDWVRRLLGRPADAPGQADGPSAAPVPDPPPPTPLPRPEPPPGPAEPEPPPPPAAARPGRIIHVHADRLEERPGPRRLTPSEALMLASDGPEALRQEPEDR